MDMHYTERREVMIFVILVELNAKISISPNTNERQVSAMLRSYGWFNILQRQTRHKILNYLTFFDCVCFRFKSTTGRKF